MRFFLDVSFQIVSRFSHGLRPKQHGTGGDAQELRRWLETLRSETIPNAI